MFGRLDNAGVGVAEGGVFAGDGDRDILIRLADAIDEPSPLDAVLILRSLIDAVVNVEQREHLAIKAHFAQRVGDEIDRFDIVDRKSTRLNSSHSQISYAVFCLKKKK